MFYSYTVYLFSYGIALECGRISKPKNTHCSADGERGAPAVVAGHTFMGSAFHFGVCASVGVCYVPLRGAIQLLHQNTEEAHCRKE